MHSCLREAASADHPAAARRHACRGRLCVASLAPPCPAHAAHRGLLPSPPPPPPPPRQLDRNRITLLLSNWLEAEEGDEEAATRPATRVRAQARRATACLPAWHRRQACLTPAAGPYPPPCLLCRQVEMDLALTAHANARTYYDARRKHQASACAERPRLGAQG